MMSFLRAEYEAIIINGPPISSDVESLLLASYVDQFVFGVFGGISRWDELIMGEQIAIHSGISVLGSVLHSGKASVSLDLQCDKQGRSKQKLESDEAIASSVKENLSAMQQDLDRASLKPIFISDKRLTSSEFTS